MGARRCLVKPSVALKQCSDALAGEDLVGGNGAATDTNQRVVRCLRPLQRHQDRLIGLLGCAVTSDEVLASKRVCILFQDDNGLHMQTARSQWRSLTEAGIAAKYWSQAQGNWELQAEKAASTA